MIYEYPKEFIVPVAYVEDLVQKRNESILEWDMFKSQYEEPIYNYNMADQRPAQGEPYRRLDPVTPQNPVVPASAPGALRSIPIEPVRSHG